MRQHRVTKWPGLARIACVFALKVLHPRKLSPGQTGQTSNLDIYPEDIKTHPHKDSSQMLIETFFVKAENWGFPGGAVVENLPANAGDTGSSPDLGRSHMPRSN